MALTHAHRIASVTSPLGKDVLLFYRMTARDHLSQLYEFEIDLLSEKKDIDLKAVIGKTMTVELALTNEGKRYFSGLVTRFTQSGTLGDLFCYRATVHPKAWLLTRKSNCRILPTGKTVPEIVKLILSEHGFTDIESNLSGSYSPRDYCVQYRETDFNFISRLLEEEGIYYYFKHSSSTHTMVLCDSIGAHSKPSQYATIPYYPPENTERRDKDHIHEWNITQEIQSGAYQLRDFDFTKSKTDLTVTSSMPGPHAEANKEVYDYPGEYLTSSDGDHYVKVRMQELHAEFEQISAKGTARDLAVGNTFKLSGSLRSDQEREYLVIASVLQIQSNEYETHGAGGGEQFAANYVVMDSKTSYRPPRITPKSMVQGPQTAIVVGKAGEEIWTDKFGRVRVKFHWDRDPKKDENSSCWVRVAQVWAGKNWGAMHIPRIGQEVIVEFLEGDPDRPIITGRVYNDDQMPPYDLPANQTQSGIKSRSSKGGGTANFNEIRFEDKKGSEQLFIHAEKNQDIEVENDETHWVGHDRSKTIDHDETTHVKHDRTETVDNNETITIGANRTENVGQNETITIALTRTRAVGVNEAVAIGAAQEIAVGAARALAVGANQSTTIGNNHSVSVANNQSLDVGSDQSNQIGKNQSSTIGENRTASVGKDDSMTVGKNLVIDAGDSIVIKTGDASISMKKDGTISIKGKDISIKGSGKINVKADSDVVIKGSKIGQN